MGGLESKKHSVGNGFWVFSLLVLGTKFQDSKKVRAD